MINLDQVVKRYDGYELNLSMEIKEGMITGIIGKNGAGKSTTIKSILGLVKPDEGKVTVFSKNATELNKEEKEMIGVALSDSSFSMYLTVKDIAAILKKMYQKFDEEKYYRFCKEQGLPLNKMIQKFSTGMKAKLKVIIAITHEAKFLVLDEPTSGLDVEARNEILDMLREYMTEDESRAILISSHISTDLEGLCDDLYLIHNGNMILHEETDRIFSNYAVLKVDEKDYESLDKQHILKSRKESFGYACLTNEKQYYIDNYPKMVIESAVIDDLILYYR